MVSSRRPANTIKFFYLSANSKTTSSQESIPCGKLNEPGPNYPLPAPKRFLNGVLASAWNP